MQKNEIRTSLRCDPIVVGVKRRARDLLTRISTCARQGYRAPAE